MAYITQYHTWTDETITAANLNGNITNITDGLSDGTKDINVGSVKINGSTALTASGDYTGGITGDVTGTVSSISTNSATDLSDITDAGSGIIISGTERTDFVIPYTDTQAASDTENPLSPAATIVKRGSSGEFRVYNTLSKNTLLASAYLYLDPAAPAIYNAYRFPPGGTPTITYIGSPYFNFYISPINFYTDYGEVKVVQFTPILMESPLLSYRYNPTDAIPVAPYPYAISIELVKGITSASGDGFSLFRNSTAEKAILFVQIFGAS